MKATKRIIFLSFALCTLSLMCSTVAFAIASKTSKFNKSYSLTGDGAKDIVAVANAQIGITNATYGYEDNWCAAFVSDCASLANQSSAIPWTAQVVDHSNPNNINDLIQKVGGTVINGIPQAGDIAICNNWGHVEIVVSVSGNSITVVGGNGSSSSYTTSKVYKSTYSSYQNSWFNEFLRPKYQGSTDPSKPTIQSNKSSYDADETATFTWSSTNNTTHYYLRFYKKTDGSYSKCVSNPQLTSAVHSYSASFSEGEYKLVVQAYNRGVWNSDHSDYKHADAEFFFTVSDTNPTAVVISGPSKGKPDERLSFSWTSTKNTTHYYLRFYKKTDGSYSKCVSNPQLTSTVHSYSASFSEGEYKLVVQAYNRGVWNSDHSDYKHVDSTYYFIVAQGTTPSTSNNNISNQGVKTASTSKPTTTIKKSQPMTVTVKKPSVKASKLKKKKQTIKLSKAFTIKNAQGVVTFTKKSGSKKLTISKNGKITVKKGAKKGKYKITVIVTAAGNANYKAGSRIVTVTVKVKK